MTNSITLNLEEPDTYVYDGPMATKGYLLTHFGLSLRKPSNREVFLRDEVLYMRNFGLDEETIKMAIARDWTGLIESGGHLQSMLKIAATVGQNLWHIGAHNAGMTAEELMEICPRNISALPGRDL